MRVAGVILAAGASRRWGADDKLMFEWEGRPMVARAADLLRALPLSDRAVVTRSAAVAAAAALPAVEPEGPVQSASLRAAVGRAEGAGADAVLLLVGDMPCLRLETLRAILAAATLDAPAALRHADGSAGVPAILPRARFAAAAAITGDRGARGLLADAALIDPFDPSELSDIDSPADVPLTLRDRA